jgi:hypothetical protein
VTATDLGEKMEAKSLAELIQRDEQKAAAKLVVGRLENVGVDQRPAAHSAPRDDVETFEGVQLEEAPAEGRREGERPRTGR